MDLPNYPGLPARPSTAVAVSRSSSSDAARSIGGERGWPRQLDAWVGAVQPAAHSHEHPLTYGRSRGSATKLPPTATQWYSLLIPTSAHAPVGGRTEVGNTGGSGRCLLTTVAGSPRNISALSLFAILPNEGMHIACT